MASQTASKIRSFTDLKAWQEAHKLVLLIYSITKPFPPEEKFGLTDQLRRAATSISSNIAEGFSRPTKKDKQKFYSTSLASLTETQNQMLIARDVGYINQEQFQFYANQSIIVGKLIRAIMKSAIAAPIQNTKF